MGAKVSKATLRAYELRERDAWRKAGWQAIASWKEALYLGGTACPACKRPKLITKPKDFFDAFDVLAVRPLEGWVAFVQVTATPFVKVRDGKADRNAEHGEPPFAFAGTPDSVDEWMRGPTEEAAVEVGTVIVSYADSRKPERRWWTQAAAPPA
jgi:hypothetical protein